MGVSDVGKRNTAQFGRRRLVPRVCVVDAKAHIRTFLSDVLEELGFVSRHCAGVGDVAAMLSEFEPDLVILGLLKPESEVTKTLRLLASAGFTGRVMLFGGRASTALLALHDLGEQSGLAMLPPLGTPFHDSDLKENLSPFLPITNVPSLPIDAGSAIQNGWLELWYQPRIDLREMTVCGAEALIRMRHPTWGIVPPASFIPQQGDPNFSALSDFVIERAMADWSFFSRGHAPIDMTVHLPAAVLEDDKFIDRMCLKLPDHAASARLTVEISSTDVRRDHARVRATARQLEAHNVGVSIDDVTAEASWIDVADFPIAELQVEDSFVNGCSHDRAKRTVCEMVLKIAKKIGARTSARGLERTADCRAVSKMGFDVGQGLLFAKPMEMHRFARTMLRQRVAEPR
jgi:EAL domain-containing protein (putative c-di-GMP-specific phosphodiesterase class I)